MVHKDGRDRRKNAEHDDSHDQIQHLQRIEPTLTDVPNQGSMLHSHQKETMFIAFYLYAKMLYKGQIQ